MRKAKRRPGPRWPGCQNGQGSQKSNKRTAARLSPLSLPRLIVLLVSLWFPVTKPDRERRGEERRSEGRRERRDEVREGSPESVNGRETGRERRGAGRRADP